ncbi:arginine deiminase family protein [Amycolatopsis sp. cmx-11-32]|uniref:arginine deiminase n=1 Tax=Amycolatopsis sp. cmx-11-32 TaxID=2785796 RepID=UPI0039E32D57
MQIDKKMSTGRCGESAATESVARLGKIGIRSEVGQLRRVVLHRPGRELDRIVPENRDSQLFDDVPWLEAAQAEHDNFRSILEIRGVEVVELRDLMENSLTYEDTIQAWTDLSISSGIHGTRVHGQVREYLTQLSPFDMCEILLSGLTQEEFDLARGTVPDHLVDLAQHYVVDPLPNAVFVRDSGTWVDTTLVGTRFASGVRRREAQYVSHAWQRAGARTLRSGAEPGPAVEGGDVLVAGNGCVLIGVSCRTSAAGATELARELLTQGQAGSVLLIRLPEARSTMHLDTVMTMVDWDTFLVSGEHVASLAGFRVRLDRAGGVALTAVDDLFGELACLLGVPVVRQVSAAGDVFTRRREQWADGANVLAIRPGVVVAYDRNRFFNDALEKAGIEVLTLPSGELARGRGGPHCMSCPVLRD